MNKLDTKFPSRAFAMRVKLDGYLQCPLVGLDGIDFHGVGIANAVPGTCALQMRPRGVQ